MHHTCTTCWPSFRKWCKCGASGFPDGGADAFVVTASPLFACQDKKRERDMIPPVACGYLPRVTPGVHGRTRGFGPTAFLGSGRHVGQPFDGRQWCKCWCKCWCKSNRRATGPYSSRLSDVPGDMPDGIRRLFPLHAAAQGPRRRRGPLDGISRARRFI